MPRNSVVMLMLAASACGGAAECITPPCALPAAIQLIVSDSASMSPIANATVTLTAPYDETFPCNSASCTVVGGSGTYELDVSAPGYRSVHRKAVVPAAPATSCGCSAGETQQLAVNLTRTN